MWPLDPRARLAGLLAAEALAVAALHGLGAGLAVDWSEPRGWLAVTPAADAAVAALRYAGLAAGWWLLLGTGSYLLAQAARLPTAAAAAARLTLPSVRRVVDRAVAAGAAASLLLAGPAPAAAELVVPPPAAPLEDPAAVDRGPAATVVVAPPLTEPGPARPPPAAFHVVAPGEHLWAIAAAVVAAADGRDVCDVTAAEVAPYWLRLVAENRDRLRSGDPDLVHPGERVVLPPL